MTRALTEEKAVIVTPMNRGERCMSINESLGLLQWRVLINKLACPSVRAHASATLFYVYLYIVNAPASTHVHVVQLPYKTLLTKLAGKLTSLRSAMDQPVPQEAFCDLASVLSCSSVILAKDLGLTNCQTKCIEEDYSDDSKERVYQVLRRWRESGPNEATWGKLVKATDSGVREVMLKYVRAVHSGEDETNEMDKLFHYYSVTKNIDREVDLKLQLIMKLERSVSPQEKEELRKRKRNVDENGIPTNEAKAQKASAKRQSTLTEFYTPLKAITNTEIAIKLKIAKND